MKKHELKVWPEYFDALEHPDPLQRKTCEIRINDRDFRVGDELRLREYAPGAKVYTGRETVRVITHIIEGAPWLPDGLAVLSLAEKPATWRRLDDLEGLGDYESVVVVGFKEPACAIKFPEGLSVYSCEHGHDFVLAHDLGYTEWMPIPELPPSTEEQMQLEFDAIPPKEKVRRVRRCPNCGAAFKEADHANAD